MVGDYELDGILFEEFQTVFTGAGSQHAVAFAIEQELPHPHRDVGIVNT
jgi:hypothetical protein